MVNKLSELVTGEQVAIWLIIAFLVAYFIYKEWPEFQRRMTKSAVKEKEDEISEKTVSERLDAIEKQLSEMNDKLTRDYDRINVMEKQQKKIDKMQRNSLEERGIIMRALLALMEGSADNEKIRESENEIQSYLVRQSHQEENY